MDWPFALAHGALCVLAVIFAAHAPANRGGAIGLAVMMTAGWALYVSAWTPANPGAALGVPNKDLWALSDGLFGVAAIGLAWWTWWGWGFWLTSLTAVTVHLAYKQWGGDFGAYSSLLDNILRAQIALFFVIGGRGVADRVLRAGRWCRNVWHPALPAFHRHGAR